MGNNAVSVVPFRHNPPFIHVSIDINRPMRAFLLSNTSIGIPAQYLQRYVPLQVLFANKLCVMVLRFYLHYYLTHVK